ncbi:MAG: EpsG family protein, partial [Chania sp.]
MQRQPDSTSQLTCQPVLQQSLSQICGTGLYIAFTILITLIYMSADIDIGADKPAYELLFSYLSNDMGVPTGFERVEPAFLAFTWLMAKLTNSTDFYFCLIFASVFLGLTCQTGKQSPLLRDRFYLVILWLSFPFFYSLSINVLRQGIALVFVVYALDAEMSRRKYRSLALLALSMMFHFSTAIFMPIILLLRYRIGLRLLLAFWALCVLCA